MSPFTHGCGSDACRWRPTMKTIGQVVSRLRLSVSTLLVGTCEKFDPAFQIMKACSSHTLLDVMARLKLMQRIVANVQRG